MDDCLLCPFCNESKSILDVDDFIVSSVVQYLGVRSLIQFGATCKSYNIVVSKEVVRRKEYIMSFEKDVARLLIDSEMNEDDKFYFAETLVYNAMRLTLHPFSEMIERYYHVHECGCCRSYTLDSVFVYEWKELQDCFYQERKKILELTMSTESEMGFHDDDDATLRLNGYTFCIICGAEETEDECDCRCLCNKCGKISDGECTCSDKICDNCGRAESDCNCCGPGCMYRGGMDENSGCTCFSIETLRMSRIYEDAVGAYTPPWGFLCCHTYVQSHLNHLPCCYNADEYGTNFWQNTLWRGSARCRERPRTKARKGV